MVLWSSGLPRSQYKRKSLYLHYHFLRATRLCSLNTYVKGLPPIKADEPFIARLREKLKTYINYHNAYHQQSWQNANSCGTIFCTAKKTKNETKPRTSNRFWKYIKNKGGVTFGSFPNFAYISSYLHLKSFAWKRDYIISSKLQSSYKVLLGPA